MAYNAQPFVGDKYLADAGQKSAALDLSGTEALGEGIKDAGKAVGEFLKSSKALKDENEYLTSQYEAMAEIGKELMPQAFGDEAIGKFHTMGLNQKRGHVAQMGSFMNTYLNEKIAKDAAAQANVYDLAKIGATGTQARMTQEVENKGLLDSRRPLPPALFNIKGQNGQTHEVFFNGKENQLKDGPVLGHQQVKDGRVLFYNQQTQQPVGYLKDPKTGEEVIGKQNMSYDEMQDFILQYGSGQTSSKDKQDARINGQKGGAVPLKTPEASGSPSATPKQEWVKNKRTGEVMLKSDLDKINHGAQ